eukprot:gene24074-biopygen16981
MQALGRLSYGWYLWHWPVLIFARALAPDLGLAASAALALGALGLAALSLKFVETPIRRSPTLASRPALSLALGGAGVVVSMLAIQLLSPAN